jgi:4'-phosphopantetheinyl transferase
VEFRYGAHGKPELVQPPGPGAVHFNLSDSGEVVVYAFLRGQEVGVDVEQLRPLADGDRISERFFSAEENAVMQMVPAENKVRAFFNCWTRKEAFLKAGGEGLSRPLDSFAVSLAPGEPAALLRVQGDAQEAARWAIHHLEPWPGYVAAVAVLGHGWQLDCFSYSAE